MIITSKAIGDGLTRATAFRPAALADIQSVGVRAAFNRLPDGDFVCVLPKTDKDAELIKKLGANKDVVILVEDYTVDKAVTVKKPANFKGVDTTGTTKDALLKLIKLAEPATPDDYFDKTATPIVTSPSILVNGEVLVGK